MEASAGAGTEEEKSLGGELPASARRAGGRYLAERPSDCSSLALGKR